MSTLVIRNIQVRGANALATPYLISTFPVFAASMFAHALSRELMPSEGGDDEVALFIHSTQLLAESIPGQFGCAPHLAKGANLVDECDWAGGKFASGVSTQPFALYHSDITLAVKIRGDHRPNSGTVEDWVQTRKFGGGRIDGVGGVSYHDEEGDGEVRKIVGGGHFVADRKDLIGGGDPVDNAARVLARKGAGDEPGPWYALATVGYSMISPVSSRRRGVRGGRDGTIYPHAFAEALVGLVEAIPTRGEQELPIFWRTEWVDDSTFVVLQ